MYQLLPIMSLHTHLARVENVVSLDVHIAYANFLAEVYSQAVPSLAVVFTTDDIKGYKAAQTQKSRAQRIAMALRIFRDEIEAALMEGKEALSLLPKINQIVTF